MTLQEPEKLDILQDRIEDLPPPLVVGALLHSVMLLMGSSTCLAADCKATAMGLNN